MPVTSRELPPPQAPRPVKLMALLFIGGFAALTLVSLAAGALTSGAPEVPTSAPTTDAVLSSPTLPPLAIITPTPDPARPTAAPATAVAPVATAVAPSPACPPADPLPAGARVGWLARSAACPDVLWARVNGQSRWVLKPADFPDDLYAQLPEL